MVEDFFYVLNINTTIRLLLRRTPVLIEQHLAYS